MPLVRKSLLVAAVVALVWTAAAAFGAGGLRRYSKLRSDMRQLEERSQKLKEDNRKLRREIEFLKDDPRGLEQAAREELGFIRQGEFVVHLEAP
jgi:cell division protein FtsB